MEGIAINAHLTQCQWCDGFIRPGKAVLVERCYDGSEPHQCFCSETCVQESDKYTGRYRPVEVGDIFEAEELAFEMDAREVRAKLLVDDWYGQDKPFFCLDCGEDGSAATPHDLWVVVAKHPDGGAFLILPWTGDEESKLLKDDPERVFLPMPIAVQYEWEDWWLEMKEVSGMGDGSLPPGTIHAFTGFSFWRSEEELSALRDTRMRKLLPGEADKARKAIARMVRGK